MDQDQIFLKGDHRLGRGLLLEKTDLGTVFNQILPKTSACGMTADISGEWIDRTAQIWPVASCPDDLHLGWLDLSCG